MSMNEEAKKKTTTTNYDETHNKCLENGFFSDKSVLSDCFPLTNVFKHNFHILNIG